MKKSIKRSIIVILALAILVVGCFTLSYFSDRVQNRVTFTTASFSKDGYTITRFAPKGPFVAREDVSVTIVESNTNSSDIQSVVTMSIEWDSPDPTKTIFGNSNAADNAILSIDGTAINYVVNADGTITFDLPEHLISKGGEEQDRILTLHIPESLESTGRLNYTFDKVKISQVSSGAVTGYTEECTREDINAAEKLDFSVRVGWDMGKVIGQKTIMGYLESTATNGQYGIVMEGSGEMHDWTSASESPQSNYCSNVVSLTIPKGITTVGDYAFNNFTKVSSVVFPDGMTSIGKSAFYASGLTTVTLPNSVTTIKDSAFASTDSATYLTSVVIGTGGGSGVTIGDKAFYNSKKLAILDLGGTTTIGASAFANCTSLTSLNVPASVVSFGDFAFGNATSLTEITFNQTEGMEIAFPVPGSGTGAFYLESYLHTKILGPNEDAQNYDWVADHRRIVPVIRSYEYVWDDSIAQRGGFAAPEVDFHTAALLPTITNVSFADANVYYDADHFAAISAMKAGAVDTYTSGNVTYWNVTDAASVTADPNVAYSVIAALDSTTGELTIMCDGGKVVANQNSGFLFALMPNVNTIDARKYDTRNVTEIYCWHWFNDPDGGYSDPDIQMPSVGATSVLGMDTWDVSNIVDFSDMFHNAENITNINVTNWDTSSAVYMNGMFKGCMNLVSVDFSGWNMENVKTIQAMFSRASGIKSSSGIENWVMPNLIDMEMAFSSAGFESLNLNKWNPVNLGNMYQSFMFAEIKSLDISQWNTPDLYVLAGTFKGTRNLASLNLSGFATSNVESMYQAFSESGIKTIDLTGWDFTNCPDVDGMFQYCSSLEDITGEETWTNTDSWESLGFMFRGCESLKHLDIGNWDVSGVKSSYYGFNYAFADCKSLTSLDVANWDVSNSESFDSMFMNCEKLTSIDISKWDMSAMTYVSYASDMFNGCRSLTELTFPASVNYLVSGMAANCPKLTTITFLSTSTETDSVCNSGYINEYNVGAFYLTPEDAAAVYPATGKVPTTIITYGEGMQSLVEGAYSFGEDNRDVGFDLPMLLSNGSWYGGSVSKTTITSITFSAGTAPATYDESWDASVTQDGAVMGYLVGTDVYIVGDGESGKIYANPDSSYAFGSSSSSRAWTALTAIYGLDILDTSYVRDMSYMFARMSSITSLDVSHFNTSKVTMAANAFYYCSGLESIDLTGWSTESLTNGYNMFYSCSNLKSMIIGSGITNFTEFQPRNLKALTEITFLHGENDVVTLPTAGSSDGAFYVSSSVATTVNTNNTMIKEYLWTTDKRTVTFVELSA